MYKVLMPILLILNTIVVYSQTEITSTENIGTWNKAGSPYNINNDITISTGTLSIESGVEINFQGNYSVTVSGTGNIKALGRTNEKIIFSANSSWAGIRFVNLEASADSSVFEYCIIQRSKKTFNSSSAPGVSERDGGAIFINSFGKVRFQNCKITNNTSSAKELSFDMGQSYGGGMFLLNAPIKIFNCDISRNYATYAMSAYGGGLYLENSDAEIVGCNIYLNKASSGFFGGGGGIACFNSNPKIINCIISENSSTAPTSFGCSSYGGGLYAYNSSPDIYNNTIVFNSVIGYKSDGGAVYYLSSSSSEYLYAYNSIFWGNTSYDSPNQLSGNAKIYNCCIQNTTIKTSRTDCITSDPLFNKVYNKDYSLKSSSPCINAGNNMYIQYSRDFNSNPRLVDGNVDIGAYEYLPSYTVTWKDWDGTLLEQQTITFGNSAIAPQDPVRDGYKFVGWDNNFSNIISDVVINAEYSIATIVAETPSPKIYCFPNPIVNRLNIELPEINEVVKVEIINAVGETIYSNKITEKSISINTSTYMSGMMIVKVTQKNNAIFTYKILKQ
jgi:hypothetical protein